MNIFKITLVLCVFVIFNINIINANVIHYIDTDGNLKNVNKSIDEINDWMTWAVYDNSINTTGWAQLDIHSNQSLDDSRQAYYFGLIEGLLTADLIQLHWDNNIRHYCDKEKQFCQNLFAFIAKNIEFMKSQIKLYANSDEYWHQIELTLTQLTGLEDGYRSTMYGIRPPGSPHLNVNVTGLILMNLITECGELEQVLQRKVKSVDLNDGHCSAIVRVLDDGSDLLVSHNSWTTYAWMLRLVKRYNMNYSNISGTSQAFSSYPGVIFSIDDYYLINSGLTVLETSIGNYNNSLWSNVVADKVVFEFIRNTVANRLARSGREWSQIFGKYNSGTYNNQFMIVDYNKYKKGTLPAQLPDDVLWVLEQLPGYVESGDVTHVLRQQNYWPSYNVPYFKGVYDLSDYTSQVTKYGDFFTYNKTARALIFRRNAKQVTDMSSLYRLMRYNDFKHDPLSRCNCTPPYTGEYAIAARCDLNDPNGHYPFSSLGFRPHGAIDVKMTNKDLFSKLEMIANSGPTYEQQPPFQWSNTRIVGVLHSGQPDTFQFPPVHVKWAPSSLRNVSFPTTTTITNTIV